MDVATDRGDVFVFWRLHDLVDGAAAFDSAGMALTVDAQRLAGKQDLGRMERQRRSRRN